MSTNNLLLAACESGNKKCREILGSNKILNIVCFKDIYIKIIFDEAIAWHTSMNVKTLAFFFLNVRAVLLHYFLAQEVQQSCRVLQLIEEVAGVGLQLDMYFVPI